MNLNFVEFRQNIESSLSFEEDLNYFFLHRISEEDSVLAVDYQKYIQNGVPVSSVMLLVKPNDFLAARINHGKQRIFFEINEHEIPEGISFQKYVNEKLEERVTEESDILAIQYRKYFYRGSPYSAVLVFVNRPLTTFVRSVETASHRSFPSLVEEASHRSLNSLVETASHPFNSLTSGEEMPQKLQEKKAEEKE